jgi:hypothetical protein
VLAGKWEWLSGVAVVGDSVVAVGEQAWNGAGVIVWISSDGGATWRGLTDLLSATTGDEWAVGLDVITVDDRVAIGGIFAGHAAVWIGEWEEGP